MTPRQRTYTFTNPDWEFDLYTTGGTGAERITRNVPALLMRNLDEEIIRRLGGVPFEIGFAYIRTPYDQRIQGAGAIRATDLRSGTKQDFDIVNIDDDPANWTMLVYLKRRSLAIGLA